MRSEQPAPHGIRDRLRRWSRLVRRDAHALLLAARDPRVPRHAKVLALCVAAYALSPIDLIPDFIPLLGQLDDLVIVPAGILLVIRLIPPSVLAEHRAAAEQAADRPVSWGAAVAIAATWILAVVLTGCWVYAAAR